MERERGSFYPDDPPSIETESVDSCLGDEIQDSEINIQNDILPRIIIPTIEEPPDPSLPISLSPQVSRRGYSEPAVPISQHRRRSSSFTASPIPHRFVEQMRPRSVAFYDRELDNGFGNNGDSYDFTGGHPPHEVYFEFPEYKEDVTEGPITSVFGGIKKKFNEAFSWKEDVGNQTGSSAQRKRTNSESALLTQMRSENIEELVESMNELNEIASRSSHPLLNDNGSLSETRQRKLTIASSVSSIGRPKGAVEHSEANRKQIADRIDLIRKNKERKQVMQRFWMPDSTSSECYNCLRPFTKIRRRHHCRICGNIFCNKCCSNYLAMAINVGLASRSERTCNYCKETAENFCGPNPVPSIESVNILATSANRNNSSGLPKASELPNWVKKISPMLGRSEEFSSSSMDGIYREKLLQDCLDDLERIWQDMMANKQGLPFVKVRYHLRTYTDCMSGQAIVDWLRQNDKVRGPGANLQAMWLGQALIDARFLAPLNRNKEFKSDANVFYKAGENAFAGNFDNSRDFFGTWRRTSGGFLSGASNGVSDSTEAEPPWVQHVHASSSEEESDYEEEQNLIESIRPPGASSLFPGTLEQSLVCPIPFHAALTESYDWTAALQSKLGRDALTFSKQDSVDFFQLLPLASEMLEASIGEITSAGVTPGQLLMPSISMTSLSQGQAIPVPVPKVKEGLEESVLNEKQSIQEISKNAYLMHMIAFLHQLLIYYEVDFKWAALLFRLSKILGETVKPRVEGVKAKSGSKKDDDLDIRRYIKVKCVPGGQMEDSRIIHGVAFSGNVTCKGMSSQIQESHVLLCRGSVECNNHRNADGDPTRLVSLQTVLGQKKMYNELCSKRILAVNPIVNLVLMEFTVTNRVQKLLMEENIAVVKNVKKSNLYRLARVLGCEVADRVENLGLTDTHYTPGKFKKFYIEGFEIGKMIKSICVFDECDKEKFATVLLRGSDSLDELRKVKHVLLEMALANYNRVLERSYFLDSNAQHRFFFKHLPFTAKIMDFTSQFLSKVVPSSHMSLLHKRSDAVQKVFDQQHHQAIAGGSTELHSSGSGPISVKQKSLIVGSSKSHASPLSTACVESPFEPNEASRFFTSRQIFRSTVLSMSPHVLISCPFLESNMGYNSPLRRYLFPNYAERASDAVQAAATMKYWSGFFPSETPLPAFFKYDGCVENLDDVEPEFDVEMLPFDETAIFHPDNFVELAPHPFLSYVTSKSLDGPEFMNLLADFRLRGCNVVYDHIKNIESRHNQRMFSKRKAFDEKLNKRRLHYQSRKQKPDCLDYRYHQKINVLILITSTNQTNDPNRLCCYLIYRDLPFYLNGDMTLGSFLNNLCFANKVCVNNQCELPPENHKRRFYSSNYCLQVSIHNEIRTPHQPPPDTILMWNFCPHCKKMSQISKMSENTWNYSFGKFLENCLSAFKVEVFHSNDSAGDSGPGSHDSNSVCAHSLFRDHHQYFMYKKRVAAFRVFKVNVYEAAFPEKFSLLGSFTYSMKRYNDEQKALVGKVDAISAEVDLRLTFCDQLIKKAEKQLEYAQNTAKGAKAKNADSFRQTCIGLEMTIKRDVPATKSEMDDYIENLETDWGRYDAILMMKESVYKYCLKWSNNLAKLSRAESDYRSGLGKETKSQVNLSQFYLQTPREDLKSVSSDNLVDTPNLETSGESTGSRNLETETFGEDDPFDGLNPAVRAVDAVDRKPAGATFSDSPIVDAATTGTIVINSGEQKRRVEDGIDRFIDKVRYPNNSPTSHVKVGLEESFDFIERAPRSSRSKLRKAREAVRGKDKTSPNAESTRGTSTSNSSRSVAIANKPSNESLNNGPGTEVSSEHHAKPEDVGKRVCVTYDSQTKQGVLKWVGMLDRQDSEDTHESPLYGGIELDEDQTEGGNGYYKDQKIFECELNRGVFAPLVGVFLIQNTDAHTDDARLTEETPMMSRKNKPTLELAHLFPFKEHEHFIITEAEDNLMRILIREDSPGSIIAYSMASNFYKNRLLKEEADINALNNTASNVATDRKPIQTSHSSSQHQETEPKLSNSSFTETRDPEFKDWHKPTIPSSGATSAPSLQPKLKQSYIEHSFSIELDKVRRCDFYCKSWYPVEFKNLRRRTFTAKENEDVERWFIKGLSETVEIKMSAGKSKAHFYQTQSKRFILKSLKSAEGFDFIEPEFAGNYFAYMNRCMDEGRPTTLCKMFGVFQVSMKSTYTDSQYRMFLIVMEHLFHGRDCSRTFDLKGVHKVLSASEPKYKEVMENKKMILDQHMTSVIQEDPIFTRPHSKHILMDAIARDGKFLAENGRIDYSLLIGLDDARGEMVVGIVDYLRKFGLDKKFEMVTKTVIIMFQNPGNRPADSREMMPTIVSPDLYYERFMIQMQQFILAVPDRWFGLESGQEKWGCGINSQGWSSTFTGSRFEKVQSLDPYPTYLSYWESTATTATNSHSNSSPASTNTTSTSNAINTNSSAGVASNSASSSYKQSQLQLHHQHQLNHQCAQED